MLVVVASELWG